MSHARTWLTGLTAAGVLALSGAAQAAGPEEVQGPGAMPECFAPFSDSTKYFQFEKKEPPYRIALANGFVGNTWRIQMIKTLKAYSEQEDVTVLPDAGTITVAGLEFSVDHAPGHTRGSVLFRLAGVAQGLDAPVVPERLRHLAATLSETELLQNCVFILNAGHETTTNLIGNALVTLQEWPQEKDQLLAAIGHRPDWAALEPVMTPAVDEFLRFESSNQLGNRRALRACEVGGVPLEEGALVTLCIGAANRDPAQFEQPDVLHLSRQDNRHLAFGFGIHQCAGLSLARLEGRVAIGRFLARFPGYRLTGEPLRGGRARFRGFLKAPFNLA